MFAFILSYSTPISRFISPGFIIQDVLIGYRSTCERSYHCFLQTCRNLELGHSVFAMDQPGPTAHSQQIGDVSIANNTQAVVGNVGGDVIFANKENPKGWLIFRRYDT